MSKEKRIRLTIILDKDTELGRLAKAAVEFMERKGIDVKSAAFAELDDLKKSANRKSKKISSRVGV